MIYQSHPFAPAASGDFQRGHAALGIRIVAEHRCRARRYPVKGEYISRPQGDGFGQVALLAPFGFGGGWSIHVMFRWWLLGRVGKLS